MATDPRDIYQIVNEGVDDPIERCRDARAAFVLCQLGPDKDTLQKYFAKRLSLLAGLTLDRVRAWNGLGFGTNEFIAGIAGIQMAAHRFTSGQVDTDGSDWSGTVMSDLISGPRDRAHELRREFREWLADERKNVGNVLEGKLRDSVQELGNAFEVSGLDRSDSIRQSRVLVQEILGDSSAEGGAFCNLILGWIALYSGTFSEDPSAYFVKASQLVDKDFKLRTAIIKRYLAVSYAATDYFREAFEEAKGAYEDCKWPEVAYEAAIYALRSGNFEQCHAYLGRVAQQEPALLLMTLADPVFANYKSVVTEAMDSCASIAQQTVRVELERWSLAGAKVGEAEAIIGTNLDLPAELRTPDSSVTRELQSCDPLESLRRCSFVRARSKALTDGSENRLQVKVETLESETQDLIETLQELTKVKDSATTAALRTRDAAAGTAQRMIQSVSNDSKSHVGCAWAMTVGFGVLAIYSLTAVFLAWRGISIAFGSILTTVVVLITALSMIVAGCSQAADMLRKAKVESEVARIMEKARREYDQAVSRVESEFEAASMPILGSLEELKSQLAKYQEALSFIVQTKGQVGSKEKRLRKTAA